MISLRTTLLRIRKVSNSLTSRPLRQALRHGVLSPIEHNHLCRLEVDLVLDVGANRGQFGVAASTWWPTAKVIAFEPLAEAAKTYRRVVPSAVVHETAVGRSSGLAILNVAKASDSSSLRMATSRQTDSFRGTQITSQREVRVTSLDEACPDVGGFSSILAKIDVQGAELDVMRGAEAVLRHVRYVYVELSFVELYAGQPLAHEVLEFLASSGFKLLRIANITPSNEDPIQADFLFEREDRASVPSRR
jgi:FkbM family methyltransferase